MVTKGGGWTTVKIQGDVGAVKAAVDAARMAAGKVNRVVSTKVIPRPAGGLDMLVHNPDTVGDEQPEPPAPPAPPEPPKGPDEPEKEADSQPPEAVEEPEQPVPPEPAAVEAAEAPALQPEAGEIGEAVPPVEEKAEVEEIGRAHV